MSATSTVDDTDLEVIRHLHEDARMSISEVAYRVGISRANAYARLRRLRRSGVVRRFTVEVDHAALGLDVTALVLLDVEQPRWADARDAIGEVPAVVYAGMASGDHDFVVLVRARDITAIRDVVLRDLRSIPGVRTSRTVLMLDEIVARSAIIPAATSH